MQRNITRGLCLNANQYCGMKIWQEIPYSDIDCPIQQICMNCPIQPCIYYDDYPWFGRYKTNKMQRTQKQNSSRCSRTRGWLSRMTKGGVCSPQVLKAFLNSPNTCDQKLLENHSDDPFVSRPFNPNVPLTYGGDLQDNIGKWSMRRIDGNRLQSKNDLGDPFVRRLVDPNVPIMYGGDDNEINRLMEVYGEANTSFAKSPENKWLNNFADYGNYANNGVRDLERYKQIMAMMYNGYPNRLPSNANYANNYAKNYDNNYGNYGNSYGYNYGDNYASQDPKNSSPKKMMNSWIKSLYEFYNDVAGGPELPKRKFRNNSSFYSSGTQIKSQYNINRRSQVALRGNKSSFFKKSSRSKHHFSSKSKEKLPFFQIYYHEPYDPSKPWTFRRSAPHPLARDKSNSGYPFNRQEWLTKVIQELDREKMSKRPEDNESAVRLHEELQRKSRSFPGHLSSKKVRNN